MVRQRIGKQMMLDRDRLSQKWGKARMPLTDLKDYEFNIQVPNADSAIRNVLEAHEIVLETFDDLSAEARDSLQSLRDKCGGIRGTVIMRQSR